MCFYNDYDWYADIYQDETRVACTALKCFECGGKIEIAESFRYVFQLEHECCQRCELEELAEGDDPCETCDYGETFQCSICQRCARILEAIKAVEQAEGCPDHALQPSLGGMLEEAFWQADDRGAKYAQKAIEMFPELQNDEFLIASCLKDG